MNQPRLEIDDLTAIIRESMASQKSDNQIYTTAPAPPVSTEQRPPQLKLQPDFQPRSEHRYHINDLLRFHDRTFVQVAYRAVLKRSPDETESMRDLNRLRSGEANKIDLIAALRFSNEGRAKHVQVEGLIFPALIRRLGQLPVIGYGIRLGISFLRLPNMVRDQRQFAGHVLAQQEQIAEFVNDLSVRLADSRHEVSRLTETLSKQLQTFAEEQQAFAVQQAEVERATAAQLGKLDQQINERLEQEIHERQEQQSEQHARLNTIEVASARSSEEITALQVALLAALEQERTERHSSLTQALEQAQLLATTQSELQAEMARLHLQLKHSLSELAIQSESIRTLATGSSPGAPAQPLISADPHHLDALYAALEDRFRGSREDIKEKFKVYLPYVENAAPVVDLGCGRGEWLEILSEAGIEARGVDMNRIQIEECRARGLTVSEEDILVHLKTLNDASAGAVTGFHIVEHVSLDTLITLLNEALRVLRPGGVVIFETPNPENVLVGSNYFYMDPTHRHPLPSELMEFLLESRGFDEVEVLKLHPWTSGRVEGDSEIADRLNAYFYGPMDYAVVGRKVSQ